MKIVKSVLAFIISIAMIIGSLTVTSFATIPIDDEGTESSTVVYSGGTILDFQNQILAGGTEHIIAKLDEDLILSESLIFCDNVSETIQRDIVFDLNGHKLIQNGNDTVFTLGNGTSFSMQDRTTGGINK